MPSPFPGMDPWLENRILWQGFHNKFVAYCESALNRVLPDGVVATTELRLQRIERGELRPDIGIVPRFATRPNAPQEMAGGVATARVAVEPLVIPLPPAEERQAYIVLRDALRLERILTAIEVLSPSNKIGRGYEQYRAKQDELLWSETSLVEIDLLRAGYHTIAASAESLHERGAVWNYLVCIHDVADRWNFRVWPLTLADRLPELPIPLGDGFAPVPLDLQAVFDACYDTSRYATLLRYDDAPETPLTDDEAQWAEEQRQLFQQESRE